MVSGAFCEFGDPYSTKAPSSSVFDGSPARNGGPETSRATLSSLWASQIAAFSRELAQRSCHGEILHRDTYRDLVQYRDLAKRSLTEILPRELSKRDCAAISATGLAKRPFIGSLYRDLATRRLAEILYRDLLWRPLTEIFCGDLL